MKLFKLKHVVLDGIFQLCSDYEWRQAMVQTSRVLTFVSLSHLLIRYKTAVVISDNSDVRLEQKRKKMVSIEMILWQLDQ